MPPTEERLDLHVNPGLRRLVEEECDRRGLTMNELVTEALARHFRRKPGEFPVPRKRPGRPRKAAN